jgi:hypothetical protein
MKKSKFVKMMTSTTGKQVIFKDDNGISRVGKLVGAGPVPDTIMMSYDGMEIVVHRKSIIGKVKKTRWFGMSHLPPHKRDVLLESMNGDTKLGYLLDNADREYYELESDHFHSPYWHKPMPASDFTRWSLV